jgi:hypothetical protein
LDVNTLLHSARGQALHVRTVVARAKARYSRERAFRAWRARAEYTVDTTRLRADAAETAETLRATKKGYEDQLAKQRMVCGEELERLRAKVRMMVEEADARDRRMRLSATTFHFHPMRHAACEAPAAFSAEPAAAAATVRSITKRDGSLGLAAALSEERLHNDERSASGGRVQAL